MQQNTFYPRVIANSIYRYLFTTIMLAIIGYSAAAQAPQGINYQAVVRNAQGQPLAQGTVVSVRFQIHDANPNGQVVFQETTTATTNQFGLINYVLGSQANLSTVNWSTGDKYLQVQIDVNGGNNYTDMGTSQLMSVPYALYAANGATGPTGLQGPTGLPGATGANGLDGATGAAGQNGLNGLTGVTGPQGLQGPTGANGLDGATGPQGPQGATGAAGQNGLNGLTGATGAQGLQGPTGANGLDGATGSQGPQGATGAAGQNGLNGLAGATGPQGLQGPTGANGLDGATGPQGMQGNTGATGPTGLNGQNGLNGNTGPTGAQGETGPQGLQGLQGPAGTNGLDGSTGAKGETGNTGPAGLQGANGLNGATGAQGPTGSQGATGAKGETGATGAQGATGSQGLQGPTGPVGPTGNDGANGNTGPQGETGPTGIPGAQGVTGAQGATGNNGLDGATGPKGDTGEQGLMGLPGETGPTGNDGPTGLQGETGAQGEIGPTGATGEIGATGPTGVTGPQGLQGPAGLQGPIGPTGADGATGPIGLTGTDGPTGPTGATGAAGSGLNNRGNWLTGTTYNAGDYVFAPSSANPSVNTMWIVQGTSSFTSSPTPSSDPVHWIEFQAPAGPQGPTGLLANGNAAGNTPYWNGTQWVVNSSNIYNNGNNVGLGTTSPLNKLHLLSSSNTDGIYIQNSNGGGNGTANLYMSGYADITPGTTRPAVRISATDDGAYSANFTIATKAPGADANALAERLRIAADGNVGIGTNNPVNKLQVAGNLHVDGHSVYFRENPTDIKDVIKWNRYADRMDMGGWAGVNLGYTDGSVGDSVLPVLTVNRDKVGIGTTTPAQRLHVAGTVQTDNLKLTNGAVNGYILKTDGAGNAAWVNPSSVTTATTVNTTSSANALTTTVNGVSSTANLINSISYSIPYPGTVQYIINGVVAPGLNIASFVNQFQANIYNTNGNLLSPRSLYTQDFKLDIYGTKGGIYFNTPGRYCPVEFQTASANVNAPIAAFTTGPNYYIGINRGDNTTVGRAIAGQIGMTRSIYTNGDLPQAIRFHTNNGGYGADISITTSGTERIRITDAGNIGVGCINPVAKMDVNVGNTSNHDAIRLTHTTGQTGNSVNIAFCTGNSDTAVFSRLRLIDNGAHSADFSFEMNDLVPGWYTDSVKKVEKFRITRGGAIVYGLLTSADGIVTYGPVTANSTLSVQGSVKSYTGYNCKQGNFPSLNPTTNVYNYYWTGATLQTWIDDVFIGNVQTTSDRRLKDRIVPSESNAISRLMQLRPVSFYYKNVEGTIFTGSPVQQEGFIADELQQVIPSAVNGDKDALTPTGKIQPQSINVAPIVSVLTKAVQEQQKLIEAQQKELEAMRKEIEELRNRK